MNVTAAWHSALHFARANPGTVTIATGSVAAVACPALLSAAVFSAAGLTASGPVTGGAFALLQSTVGGTPAVAAILQSAAMGGYGVAIVNGVVQTGGAIAGLAALAHGAKLTSQVRSGG